MKPITDMTADELRVELSKEMGWTFTKGLTFQLLCDKLARMGWTCGIDNTMNGKWFCEFSTIQNRHRVDHSATADTLTLAISCAALSVFRSIKQKP